MGLKPSGLKNETKQPLYCASICDTMFTYVYWEPLASALNTEVLGSKLFIF